LAGLRWNLARIGVMKRLRVYADTSVLGGCLDAEFAEASRAFFMEVAAGRFLLVISDETVRELAQAQMKSGNCEMPICTQVLSARPAPKTPSTSRQRASQK